MHPRVRHVGNIYQSIISSVSFGFKKRNISGTRCVGTIARPTFTGDKSMLWANGCRRLLEVTLTDQHKIKLKMEQTHGDFLLFLKRITDSVIWISGTHVRWYYPNWKSRDPKTVQRHYRKTWTLEKCQSTPFAVIDLEVNSFEKTNFLGQEAYLQDLIYSQKGQGLTNIDQWERAKSAWNVHSRTYIPFSVSMAAQATQDT